MKKNILIPMFAASLLLFSACTGGSKSNSESGNNNSGNTSITPIDDDTITIKFYLDYNQVSIDNVYETYQVKNGSLLTEPARPTSSDAPLPEYPSFVGWSQKQIIDSTDDLWDFAVDKVNMPTGVKTLRIYGFWATV